MNAADFQTQLTSIMDMLTKSAVVEISKLFDKNSLLLRLEISRCTTENESLKKKCNFLETELQAAKKTRNLGTEASFNRLTETVHRPSIDSVFGKEWCMNLWSHDESITENENTHLQPSDTRLSTGESLRLQDEERDAFPVKQEKFEDSSFDVNDDETNRLRAMIQEKIKSVLPELDISTLQTLVSHLTFVMGVEKIEDLSHVEESDVLFLLDPKQCRKLVKSFKQTESGKEDDGTPREVFLTPLSSAESLPEVPLISLCPTSTDWYRNFQIPWHRMPESLVHATLAGERGQAAPRREFVRILVAAMQMYCPNPTLTACGEVARHIVSTYPLTFGDISEEGEQLGNGFSWLQRQLKTRVEHVNRDNLENRIRKPRKLSLKRDRMDLHQDAGLMKKFRCKTDSYGCINWQPTSIPDGETSESLEMKRKVAAEIFQSAGPRAAELPNVDDLMQQTYVYQRHMINSYPTLSIPDLEQHWPFLFTDRGLCKHFETLTGIDIRSRFSESLNAKSRRILNYFHNRKLKCSEEMQHILNEFEVDDSQSNDKTAIVAMLLMLRYFKEKENALFILADEASTKKSIENDFPLPSTPRLIMLGDTVQNASKWFICIDGRVTHSVDNRLDFAAALSVFFACYYVFNIEYQESACTTLEFIQRFLVRINPEGSKCTSKSGTSRRTGSIVKRKSQNLNSRVASFMQRLSEFELTATK